MPKTRSPTILDDDIPDYNIPPATAEELKLMGRKLNRVLEIVGQAELARRLGIKSQAIGQWEVCPPIRARQLEYLTKRRVTRYQLRPDIFGDGSDV